MVERLSADMLKGSAGYALALALILGINHQSCNNNSMTVLKIGIEYICYN